MSGLETLSSPVVLFFLLGAMAAFARSDLSIPESIAKGISLYLMAAIGLKGGVEVSSAGFSIEILKAAALGISLSFLLPIPAYFALLKFAKVSYVDAAASAAHYGSVSVVTFVTGVEILGQGGMPPAGYMVAVMALMETPAIISGLMLAKKSGTTATQSRGRLLHETLLNGSVVLLIGAFMIGLITGKEGMKSIEPVFDTAFRGVLCFFLLDMGLVAVRRLMETNKLSKRVVVLALGFPIVNGSLGVLAGAFIGLDSGTVAAMGILAGSASYIAVPAVMRLALPQADPGLYLGMSLAVTFPFNILLGIPYYSFLSTKVAGL